jgi:uncharacterized Zn-binding protein involved in type VI secretion
MHGDARTTAAGARPDTGGRSTASNTTPDSAVDDATSCEWKRMRCAVAAWSSSHTTVAVDGSTVM